MNRETHHHSPESTTETLNEYELNQQSHEIEKARHERAENAKKSHEHTTNEARQSIQQEAISGKEMHKPHSEKRHTDQIRTHQDRTDNFNITMKHVRQNLSRPEKNFSKFIHKPAVEKASDLVGKTIARPSGIVGGTIAVFIGLLSVYGVAKFAGFPSSGSEMPLLLIIGFALGLFCEWAYKAVRVIFSKKARTEL